MRQQIVEDGGVKRRSQLGSIWFRFRKNKIAMISLLIFLVIVLAALSADTFFDYSRDAIDQNVYNKLLPPSAEYPLGTDDFGRNLLARIVYGARMSLKIAFIVVFFALIIALVLGAVAAYYGGVVDGIIMRICDVFLSVPHLLLAVTVVAALGTGVDKLIIALTIAQIPTFIRIVRSAILQVMNSDFIECAKAYGTKDFRLIVTQILPNALSPIIVKTTQDFASIILQISSLGFIGLGVPSPTPEWGTMVAEARSLMRSHPTMMIYPGIAITITVLAINLIGDGLRDALDPKLKN